MNKYQEGNTVYKISLLEYELLKYYFHKGYKYIARNNDESLFIYRNKPQRINYEWCVNGYRAIDFKGLFSFIKWEDEEPTLIQNILDNCEVVEDVGE